MKGRFLFFLIGLLPFLFSSFVYSASHGDLRLKVINPGQSNRHIGSGNIRTSFSLIVSNNIYSIDYQYTNYGTEPQTGYGFVSAQIMGCTPEGWRSLSTLPSSCSNSLYSQAFDLSTYNESETCTIPSLNSCPDTDGDGLCDPCDQWPDDPNVGNEWYLKGYLKYKGKIVGSYGSPSKSDSSYDRFSVADEYAEPDGFPGLGLMVGAAPGSPSGFIVNQDIFHKAGGETVFLSDPPLMFKTSCAPVDDITQCGPAICQDDKVPEVEKEDYPLNNSEVSTEEPYIELDKPYFKPIAKSNSNNPVSTDPCPEHRALCSNTCGGSRKVSNFACAGTGGNSHVICSCDSAGGYEFAPGFSDIGDLSFSTATSTKFGSGTGKDYDPNSIGSETDDLNQDGDATNDSYAYKEGQVDFAPIQAAYGRLTGKFPFNLANSFIDVFRPFANAQGSTPTFNYEVIGHDVRFDLSPFNDFARFIRSMFALGLTLSTILALLYIYIGIDFRRK